MIPLDNLSRESRYKVLGEPLKQPIELDLWKSGELVKPMNFPDELRIEKLYLNDFALSVKVDTLHPYLPKGMPPIKFCSPDRLHRQKPSFACDIWSYMCIFAELYLCFVPFSTWLEGGIVTSMVELLGPLPEEWKGLYLNSQDVSEWWYDQDYKINPEFNLRTMIANARPEADPVEVQHAYSLMVKGFSCNPAKRPTSTQLLQDPSFKYIMEKYCG